MCIRDRSTGRRKSSVARIRMTDGSGSITVNGISAEDYFGTALQIEMLKLPFQEIGAVKKYDIIAPKEKFIEQLKNYFPNNKNDLDKYLELIDRVSKSSINYFSAKALSGLTEKVLSGYLRKNFLKFRKTLFQI